MAKRWLIGGLAVGVGALVLAPETRTWLRRRLGLEPEDRRWFEEEGAGAPEYEGDEPLDTRESRFSLRARLSEEVHEPAPAAAEDEPVAAEPEPEPIAHELAPEPAAEDVTAEPRPAPAPHLSAVTPLSEPALDPEPEPAAEELAPEPEPEPEAERAPYLSAVTPEPWPRSAEPESAPEPEPEPAEAHEPESAPSAPAPTHWPAPYESVPSIAPEADAPKTPGEDTDEVAPLPGAESREGSEEPLTPPTELRPPTAPTSRPFSSEGASFRSAIDAARERVHGAAREATPDEGDAEPGEQSD
ncbi:MAG: hypothetical protein QOC86_1650 [Gaiellales bacterium]|nr:hypothetical protein [Gaiellales bacterium]